MNSGESGEIELNDPITNTSETTIIKELTINPFFYIGIIIKILFWFFFYFNLPSSSSRDSFFNDEEFDVRRPIYGLIIVLISTLLVSFLNMYDTLPYPDIFLTIYLLISIITGLIKKSFFVFLMVFIYLILSSVYFLMNSTIILNGSNDLLKFLYLAEAFPVIFVLVYTISKTF